MVTCVFVCFVEFQKPGKTDNASVIEALNHIKVFKHDQKYLKKKIVNRLKGTW